MWIRQQTTTKIMRIKAVDLIHQCVFRWKWRSKLPWKPMKARACSRYAGFEKYKIWTSSFFFFFFCKPPKWKIQSGFDTNWLVWSQLIWIGVLTFFLFFLISLSGQNNLNFTDQSINKRKEHKFLLVPGVYIWNVSKCMSWVGCKYPVWICCT